MTSSISLIHLCTFYYCYIRYISLNTLLSAILTSYEVKLLEDVDICHLRAQLHERNNKYRLFNINLSGIKLWQMYWVMKRKKIEPSAHKIALIISVNYT